MKDIRHLSEGRQRTFGSVKVRLDVGASTEHLDPARERQAYVLPITRAIRTAESLQVGDVLTVRGDIVDP